MSVCNGLHKTDPRFTELELAISRYRDRNDGLVCVLERAKYLFGLLPLPVLHAIADRMGLTHGDLYQAVAADDLFPTRPAGRYLVSVCLGTHCYLAGSGSLLDRLQAELQVGPGETTPDGLFALTVCFEGEHSDGEPAFYIDGVRFAVRPDQVATVLDSFRPAVALTAATDEGP